MSTGFEHGHAVLVGAGADLPNTVDDAKGLAGILTDPGRCAFPAAQVVLLTGQAATREAILAALDGLVERAAEDATAVIFFSGHGYRVQSTTGEAYYLMPYGYELTELYKTAISDRDLADRLGQLKAGRLLLLLDCCHAGGLDETKDPLPAGLTVAKAPLPPGAGAMFQAGRGRVVIASSRGDEKSFAGRPYSAFTLALIEALSGQGVAKKDGYVRVTDVALYTGEMVPRRTKDRQHPILNFTEADNFVVAYYAGGETQPKGLPFEVEPEIEDTPGQFAGINTQGGAFVRGNVNTGGGDFVGRDKIVHGDEVRGDKIGGDKIGGDSIDRT